MPNPNCVFCHIATGKEEAAIQRNWHDCLAFTPLNPVTAGHTLVIPRTHIDSVTYSPRTAALTMNRACEYADTLDTPDINFIVSQGTNATQTIKHLHIHVIPRRPGDGLHLPWTCHD